jgi:hypothetical protein
LPNSNEGIAHAEGIFVLNAALGFVPASGEGERA